MSTDRDWERWGKDNPYFGVLSDEKFKGAKLKPKVLDEFYRSGVADIELLMDCLKLINGGKRPTLKHAVDFGCGVGRLTVPLSAYARQVTGLDVSPSMIKKARAGLPKDKRRAVNYAVSDDSLAGLPASYDLAYSYIVLQHIPTKRGQKIIAQLADKLEPGGYLALHVTYKHRAPAAKRLLISARSKAVPFHYALNALKGRPIKTPLMRMHLYDLSSVSELLYDAGIERPLQVLTDHGGYLGALIVGQKRPT